MRADSDAKEVSLARDVDTVAEGGVGGRNFCLLVETCDGARYVYRQSNIVSEWHCVDCTYAIRRVAWRMPLHYTLADSDSNEREQRRLVDRMAALSAVFSEADTRVSVVRARLISLSLSDYLVLRYSVRVHYYITHH